MVYISLAMTHMRDNIQTHIGCGLDGAPTCESPPCPVQYAGYTGPEQTDFVSIATEATAQAILSEMEVLRAEVDSLANRAVLQLNATSVVVQERAGSVERIYIANSVDELGRLYRKWSEVLKP